MYHQRLHLTTKESHRRITDLIKDIEETHNINVQIIDEPCCNGYVDSYNQEHTLVKIGNQPIHPPISLFTNGKVSDIDFLQMITTMFHELTHHLQNKYVYQNSKSDKEDIYLTIHEIATRKNPFYYKPFDMHNYVHDPTEIMAEYQGIMQTYNYLQNEFEDIPANTKEQIMVDFVNHCQKAPYYWIHSKKPFQSMEEIENAFEIAYKKSKFIKRKYFEYENQNEILDENMRFMKQYPEIIQRFENANTGYQQDKIMACIACYLHPEFKEYYQSIQSVDLSPKTVLDMQLQEEPFFDYHPEIKHDRTAALAFYEEKFNTETPNFDNDFDYP